MSRMRVADDDLQYETCRKLFSSLTTEDKIFVASNKNRAVCARLKSTSIARVHKNSKPY